LTAEPSLEERFVRLVLETQGVREDERLHGIRGCIESVIEHGIPGDLIVTGSRQGATTVFARALLAANRVTDRWLWVASPEGSWRDLDGVRDAFARAGLLDDTVRFIEGPMWRAVPAAPIEQLAIIHFDAGTDDAVEHLLGNLYPRLAVGGFTVVDGAAGADCRAAVERFRTANNITNHLRPLADGCVTWRKERA
jgi:hypothetical protein